MNVTLHEHSLIHRALQALHNPVMWRVAIRRLIIFFFAPALIYLVGFYIFTPAYLGHFTTHFFIDNGDGFQNVWNIWWIDKAVTQLGQHPWFTHYVEWPYGVSLLPQTMNPFNGFMAIPLLHLAHFSLIQVVNTVVVFSFVMSGVTMFWLAYYLTRSYHGAIFAGILFTFSSYHFAHAIGHMQLITMEWMPLFLLAWWRLCQKPTYLMALAASGSLLLVFLSDFYYLFYSVIAAAGIFGYHLLLARRAKDTVTSPAFRPNGLPTNHMWRVLAVFALVCIATIGRFIYALLKLNAHDKLAGAHSPRDYGMDFLSPFIPGESWYWHDLTKWYWHKLPVFYSETSLYLGLVFVGILVAALIFRRRLGIAMSSLAPWWALLGGFWLLSLGPRLRFLGNILLPHVPMPYSFLGKVLPVLSISGMPNRMFVMVVLAGAVIAAFVIGKLNLRRLSHALFFAGLLVVLFIDVRPRPLPLTPPIYPPYVTALKNLPISPKAGIIDWNSSATLALYYQTIHQKPMAFGYLTRLPTSSVNLNWAIYVAIEKHHHWERLCQVYHIRYFAVDKYYNEGYPIVYQDPTIPMHIYDVKNGEGC